MEMLFTHHQRIAGFRNLRNLLDINAIDKQESSSVVSGVTKQDAITCNIPSGNSSPLKFLNNGAYLGDFQAVSEVGIFWDVVKGRMGNVIRNACVMQKVVLKDRQELVKIDLKSRRRRRRVRKDVVWNSLLKLVGLLCWQTMMELWMILLI